MDYVLEHPELDNQLGVCGGVEIDFVPLHNPDDDPDDVISVADTTAADTTTDTIATHQLCRTFNNYFGFLQK